MTTFVLLSMLFFAAAVGGEERRSEQATPEALLRETVQAQRVGNFEVSWQALMAFFGHPDSNEVDIGDFGNYFLSPRSSTVWRLGSFLGKSKVAAVNIEAFCPQWNRQRAQLRAEMAGEPPEAVDTLIKEFDFIRSRALHGSCAEWRQRQLVFLHEQPVARPLPSSQTVSMEFEQFAAGHILPRVEISIADQPVSAIADTGSSDTSVLTSDPILLSYLSGAKLLQNTSSVTPQGSREYATLRTPSIRLGNTEFREVLIDRPAGAPRKEFGYVLGMNVLLQYPSVCFDWQKNRLHLGTLGPCRDGISEDNAYLTGTFVLYLSVTLQDGSVLPVLLDTGATGTECSKAFVSANDGRHMFAFGHHPDQAAECYESFDSFFPSVGSRFHQARLGMDTFRQFAAFGWELNPLRVYFVPKQTDD